VRGSPFDSIRSGRTLDSWLGVKESPVQIRPSRQFFERLYPKLGTKSAMIVPTRPAGRAEHPRCRLVTVDFTPVNGWTSYPPCGAGVNASSPPGIFVTTAGGQLPRQALG
jgi:hypothetical protein